MACWSPKVCSVGDARERKKIPFIKSIWAVVEGCVDCIQGESRLSRKKWSTGRRNFGFECTAASIELEIIHLKGYKEIPRFPKKER